MPRIIMIACVDGNWGIGDSKGNLLFDIPNDLRHFKRQTEGKVVVMGRKTFDSFGSPLRNRYNYVLTSNEDFSRDGVAVLRNKKDVLELAESLNVFIIGGGEVYKQFMDVADALIITHVEEASDKATTFFPEIKESEWRVFREEPIVDDLYEVVAKWYERRD